MVTESGASLVFDKVGELPIEHDANNHLPTGFAKKSSQSGEGTYLAGVLDVENENLTGPQKLLIHWHECFGHKSMSRVQKLFCSFPFLSKRFKASSKMLDLPMCATCQYAKAHRRTTKGSI